MNKKLKVDKLSLSYEAIGQGNKTLVFIHGMGCNHQDWEYQIAHFKNKYQCLALDLRGHGESGGTEADDYSIATFANDVGQLLEAARNKSVVLIGHSMGCRIALELYSQQADKISHLILVDGSKVGQGDPEEVRRTMLALLDNADYKATMQRLFMEMLSDITSTEIKQRILTNVGNLAKGVTKKLAPDIGIWDAIRFDEIVPTLSIPVLLIQSTYLNPDRKRIPLNKGDSSPFIELFQQYQPMVKIQIVERAGHFPMLEQPAFVNKTIERFLMNN